MTCLRSDRKCIAKAFGRSKSKLGLMSYPSFILVFIHGLKIEDITQRKAIFTFTGKKKKATFFFFFPLFLLLSIELKICCELNRSMGI